MLPTPRHNTRLSPASILRDAWLEVSLSNLEHNIRTVRSWLKPSACRFMAVVKSDAYGHGAASTAELFQAAGADYLGVASIDEGTQLRAAGNKLPILILSPTPAWAIDSALDNDLDITITTPKQLEDVVQVAKRLNRAARIHLKVDTGMHRLGIAPERTASVLDEIVLEPALKLVSIYSHLAKAGDQEAVHYQRKVFEEVRLTASKMKGIFYHLASSEATRLFADTHYDMVRVGLYLYGLEPNAVSTDLKPALSVRARINHIGEIEQGQSVGYSWTWTAPRPTRLASIPIGYGDGVDRGLSNNLIAHTSGKTIKQVGRISMDQMLFDITDVPEAQEGDVVTLIGEDEGHPSINLSQWANSLDTITYELACRMRARLPRVYTRSRAR
jgi:alanine racemase